MAGAIHRLGVDGHCSGLARAVIQSRKGVEDAVFAEQSGVCRAVVAVNDLHLEFVAFFHGRLALGSVFDFSADTSAGDVSSNAFILIGDFLLTLVAEVFCHGRLG